MRKRFGKQQPKRSQDRTINTIPVKVRFLVVCEGEKTEPLYFQSFNAPGLVVEVKGTGMNTLSLVEEAIRQREEEEEKLKRRGYELFDQCWCVFDRDSFPSGNFNSAIHKANANGFQVAYSNVAFELWYLLHFGYYDSAMSREQYREKLTQLLGYRYEKNSTTMYFAISHLQQQAIQNAVALQSFHHVQNPEQNNPSTTVHELVQQLNTSAGVLTP